MGRRYVHIRNFLYISLYVKIRPIHCGPTMPPEIMISTNLNMHYLRMLPHKLQLFFLVRWFFFFLKKNLLCAYGSFGNYRPSTVLNSTNFVSNVCYCFEIVNQCFVINNSSSFCKLPLTEYGKHSSDCLAVICQNMSY